MFLVSAAILLVFLSAGPAHAGPLLTGFTTWFAGLGLFGQTVVRLGLSILLNFAASALMAKGAGDANREFQVPRSRVPKRFVYGRYRMYGTPATWKVKGDYLYGCLIFNSRPSAGGEVRAWLDKRACFGGGAAPASVFDFAVGASLEPIEDFPSQRLENRPRIWIGLGDQTSPPDQILAEVGPGGSELDGGDPLFLPTDGWTGCTVVWCRFVSDNAGKRSERFPNVPPQLEIEMDWSRVWDPRDASQDPDDPSTWAWSNNQALVLLDSLRMNPIREYTLEHLDLTSFITAADVADELIPLFHEGGSEPRYRANGFIVWNGGEIVDQIQPVADAGGGFLYRSGGLVGYAPGIWTEPVVTLSDIEEQGGIDFQVNRPDRELPRWVRVSYVRPQRDWQDTELPIRPVPGVTTGTGEEAVREIKLPFVTSATQAQRLQQIAARRFGMQRRLAFTAFPEAFRVTPGDVVVTAFPGSLAVMNGYWQVETADPAIWLAEPDTGVAFRVPLTLVETAENVFEWVPETDEVLIEDDEPPERPADRSAPTDLRVETGPGVSFLFDPRFRISWAPARAADAYEIQMRVSGETYAVVQIIEREAFELDENGRIYVFAPVVAGQVYDVRVRALRYTNRSGLPLTSDWAEVTGVLADAWHPEYRTGAIGSDPVAGVGL